MTFRRWAAITAVVVVTAVASLIVWAGQSRPVADGYTGHAASPSPSATSAVDGPSAADQSQASGVDSDGSESPSNGSSGSVAPADQPTWDPAAGVPEGADAEPKVPGGLGTEPYRLPAVAERQPALSSLPPAAAADGELATGFPEDIIPIPEDAEIQSSSVSPQGQRVLVGLHALSDVEPAALLDYYVAQCEELGWAVSFASDPAGHQQLQCGFGGDSMSAVASLLPTGRTDLTATGAFAVPEN